MILLRQQGRRRFRLIGDARRGIATAAVSLQWASAPASAGALLLRLTHALTYVDALRETAGEPLAAEDIANRGAGAKGFDLRDTYLRAAIREQVGAVLKRLHRRGVAEPSEKGRGTRWRLTT